jgi:hypothetical protein
MIKKVIAATLVFLSIQMNAQFFRGVGLFVGGTTASHRYVNAHPIDEEFFAHTFPAPSHRSGELISFSVGLLGEFLKYDHIRWQTELEYCTKGAIESPLIAPWPPVHAGPSPNAYQNIEWNNFAKIFGNEGYRGTPYLMLGARLDYNFSRSITAYHAVAGTAPKINLSPDVGIGYEFSSYSKWHIFTEFHYNPDAIKRPVGTVLFWGRMFELRLGIIYRPRKALDDCNAPRYQGADY